MLTLRQRLNKLLISLNIEFDDKANDGMAPKLVEFICAEIGRSADSSLENTLPLVLYFENDKDRDEFIDAVKAEKPTMVARKIGETSSSIGVSKKPEPPPVDRSAQSLTDGSPVTDDHRELKENGQQKGYVVLTAAERARGFMRPVRHSYVHQKCGVETTMGTALAETYARDPNFYSGTFCVGCGKHFPVGEDGEFVWSNTSEKVGT